MAINEKIKVLIVLNTLGAGGAEVQAARLAQHFDKNLFDVQVAYYENIDIAHPADMLKDAGIKVTYLDRPKWGRFRYFFKATAFMRREHFDVVHAFTGTTNLYARAPAIMAGVPVIIGGLRGQSGMGNLTERLIFSLTNWRCAGWIVNAIDLKTIIEQKLWFMKRRPIFVVPNGLELKDTKGTTRDGTKFFDELRTDRLVVGTIGRLVPVKNHLLFIEMAAHLRNMGQDVDYWIVGDGPMRPEIEQAIAKHNLADRVKMLGYRADVKSALSRMDVFVLTSDTEGCPNVLLEAMRASLPVVATSCTDLREIIQDGANGYTALVGDARKLAEKVKHILADTNLRKQMAVNSRKIVEERFDISLAVKRMQDVYIDCLKRASKRKRKLKMKLKAIGA